MLTKNSTNQQQPRKTKQKSSIDISQDHELLKSMANGDEDAFESLYYCYRPYIQAFLRKYVQDPENLDEVLNDVMVAIWLQATNCPPTTPLLAWLYGIARNQARTCYARTRRQAVPTTVDVAETDDPEEHLLRQDWQKTLSRAIWRLPLHERRAVELLVYHGYSYKDIARQLDAPINTIKARMRRAYARLSILLSNAVPS